jgi:hypothetical protein
MSNSLLKIFKIFPLKILILISLIFFGLSCFFLNVSVETTKSDEYLILNYFNLPKVEPNYTYKEKVDLAKKVVFTISSFGSFEALPVGYDKNLLNFLKFNKGLCFDRSIIYEKIFKYYGFKVHHYYVGFNDSKFGVLFKKNTISHTFLSIEIDGKELFIDSNQYFLSLDKNDRLIDSFFRKIKNNEIDSEALWWTKYFKEHKESLIIRGLYSRNGYFFKPYLPIPDVNFVELKFFWRY